MKVTFGRINKFFRNFLGFNIPSTTPENVVKRVDDLINPAVEGARDAVASATQTLERKSNPVEGFVHNPNDLNLELERRIKALEEQNNGLKSANSKLQKDNSKLQEDNSELQKNLEEQKQRYKTETEQLQEENNSLNSQLEFKEDVIQNLNKENDGFKDETVSWRETARKAQQALEPYRKLAKEAYRQGITPEIREQKAGIADILESLIQHKQKPAAVQPSEQVVPTKPVSKVKTRKGTKKTTKKTATDISEELIERIKLECQKQVLDKGRMEKASSLIKSILDGAPDGSYEGIQKHFQKIMNRYLKSYTCKKTIGTNFNGEFHPYEYHLSLPDDFTAEIYAPQTLRGSYICFNDKNGKELLYIGFHDDHYSTVISDKEGRGMVRSSTKDGVIKYLNVCFNDVKPTSEIESDIRMNNCAQNLIEDAKLGTVRKQKYEFCNTDYEYYNQDNVVVINEAWLNEKNKHPVFISLNNPQNGKREKLISQGDFSLHAKYDKKSKCWVQYNTPGVTGIEKFGKDEKRDFNIKFYRTTDNEHWEVQSLHDRNYSTDILRPVYEKRNYGTVHHPLTQSFTFHDLSKHKIKPWDFSILKPYIK